MENYDIDTDLSALYQEAAAAVERVRAADAERAAAGENLVAVRAKIVAGFEAALATIDAINPPKVEPEAVAFPG